MKIALYGATGMIGQRILAEALRRGHTVTAIVRDPARLTVTDDNLSVKTGDATDAANVAASVTAQDAVIGSISGRRDGDAGAIPRAAQALIDGTQKAGVERLLWVGGAGSLLTPTGDRLMDAPDFPEMYRAEANAGAEVLELFRVIPQPSKLNWSYLSPAAEIAPGERTGTFRLSGDHLLTDAEGRSRVSAEDYAVALIDEVETPRYDRQRFSVAY